MTPEELNKALLVERFTPGPRRVRTPVYVQETPVPDDSDVATARRRRDLKSAISRHEKRTA